MRVKQPTPAQCPYMYILYIRIQSPSPSLTHSRFYSLSNVTFRMSRHCDQKTLSRSLQSSCIIALPFLLTFLPRLHHLTKYLALENNLSYLACLSVFLYPNMCLACLLYLPDRSPSASVLPVRSVQPVSDLIYCLAWEEIHQLLDCLSFLTCQGIQLVFFT